MNIIEELYYGNIITNEKHSQLSDELKELLKLLNRNEDEFLKTLSAEQKIIFEKLKDCNREISEISEREAFLCGFQLGAKIIIVSVNSSTHKSLSTLILLRLFRLTIFRYLLRPRKISVYTLTILDLCEYIRQIFLWDKVMRYCCLNDAIYNC